METTDKLPDWFNPDKLTLINYYKYKSYVDNQSFSIKVSDDNRTAYPNVFKAFEALRVKALTMQVHKGAEGVHQCSWDNKIVLEVMQENGERYMVGFSENLTIGKGRRGDDIMPYTFIQPAIYTIEQLLYDIAGFAKEAQFPTGYETADFCAKCIRSLCVIYLHPDNKEYKDAFFEYLSVLRKNEWLAYYREFFEQPTVDITNVKPAVSAITQLYDRINDLRRKQNSPLGVAGDAAKFNEEVGELNRLVSMDVGMQTNPLSESQFKSEFAKEAADILQNLFILCQNKEITWGDLHNALTEKNAKWEKDINSGKYASRYKPLFPVGYNINKPSFTVKHGDLIDADDKSIYRKTCPVCEYGILLVGRESDFKTLRADDRCCYCGQHFIYSDVAEIESAERVNRK